MWYFWMSVFITLVTISNTMYCASFFLAACEHILKVKDGQSMTTSQVSLDRFLIDSVLYLTGGLLKMAEPLDALENALLITNCQ